MRFKRAKNEHVYSKGPLVVNSNNTENYGCFLRYLHKDYENILLRYMEQILQGENELMIPPYENLKYIINDLKTQDLRQNILKKTMTTRDYSPFYENIPLDSFGPNERKNIEEIQDFIKKYFNTNIVVGNTYIKYNDGKKLDFEFFNKQKIDYIILLKKNSCEIHELKKVKNSKMEELHNYLSNKYPNVWQLTKSKKLIKVENYRCYSGFDKEIVKILNS